MSPQKGPRWRLLERREIRHEVTGEVIVRRLYLVETPWFGVMLHHLVAPDPDRALHDHPWSFASIILSGGYTETVDHAGTQRHWPTGTVHCMPAERRHRVAVVLPGTRTLILRGRKRRMWGFWPTTDTFVPWRAYSEPVRP